MAVWCGAGSNGIGLERGVGKVTALLTVTKAEQKNGLDEGTGTLVPTALERR